jgi:hypothetical protein
MRTLLVLRAKPLARFSGKFSPAESRSVAHFLLALAAADEKAVAKAKAAKEAVA